ncbi:hypothetical protein BKA70DRAFT_1567296 [Coprinopsis sp. MPI-PUGE-AT-0042]|nr:hypothetical protein BKA70DRAFT_1567296 [Coprinopsis sp. MPI-PUGE-AT-0042]
MPRSRTPIRPQILQAHIPLPQLHHRRVNVSRTAMYPTLALSPVKDSPLASLLPKICMDNADVWIHLHRVSLGSATLLIKRRLPPRNVPGGLFGRKLLKSTAFLVNYASRFFAFLNVYTSQSVSATQIGISGDLLFNFVALANQSSLFGRWAAGVLSVDLINAITPFTASAAILTYAWPYAHSKEFMIVLTGLDGSLCPLLTNPIFEFGDTDGVGSQPGMAFIPLDLGVIAVLPISGATLTALGASRMLGIIQVNY